MGARAVANYVDRDIDALMARTRRRPLPAGLISPVRALGLGLALIELGLVATLPFGPVIVLLMAFGLVDNLLVYARLTKRTSPLSIVMGAPSGGAPALIGHAAVAGAIHPMGLALAMFVVLWTPIHIWSLAILYRDDYARARVPMVPVVAGVGRSAAMSGSPAWHWRPGAPSTRQPRPSCPPRSPCPSSCWRRFCSSAASA
jgi:protoheme IX farnesyltransferase